MTAAAAMRMETPMLRRRMEIISPFLVCGRRCSRRCAAPRTLPSAASSCNAPWGDADQAPALSFSGGLQLVGGTPSGGAVAHAGSSSRGAPPWSAAWREGSLNGLSSAIVAFYSVRAGAIFCQAQTGTSDDNAKPDVDERRDYCFGFAIKPARNSMS